MVIGIVAFVHLANTFAVLAGVMGFYFIVKGVFGITLSIGAKHILDVGLRGLGRRNADQVLVYPAAVRQGWERLHAGGKRHSVGLQDRESGHRQVGAGIGCAERRAPDRA